MHTYYHFENTPVEAGSIIIKFYHSGDTVRGYLRQVSDGDEKGTIFPGEELEPKDAFMLAENKMAHGERHPIYVEMAEDIRWDPAWGRLV